MKKIFLALPFVLSLIVPTLAKDTYFRSSILSVVLDNSSSHSDGGEGDVDKVNSTITLRPSSPFEFTVGSAIDALDMKYFVDVTPAFSIDMQALSFSIGSLPLPPGISLSGSSLMGTPTQSDTYDFELFATHPDVAQPGSQTYRIVINGRPYVANKIAIGHTSCLITENGGVKCWGANGSGQLGNGNSTGSKSPVDVLGISTEMVSIYVGSSISCSIDIDGDLYCWGRNSDNILPYDHPFSRAAKLTTPEPFKSVAVGTGNLCGIGVSGSVYCRGNSNHYRLGNSTGNGTSFSAVSLSGAASNVISGYNSSCALLTNGRVECWGHNGSGTIGTGSLSSSGYLPRSPIGLESGVSKIFGMYMQVCAEKADGIYCWGNNNYGGILSGSESVTIPTKSDHFSAGVKKIIVNNSSCVLYSDGSLYCVGYNERGELGNGATFNSPSPVPVISSGVKDIFGFNSGNCALLEDDTLKCWGTSSDMYPISPLLNPTPINIR